MNFTSEQYRLIFTAVRRYQIDKCLNDSKEYWQCNKVLDELFDIVYTQRVEQST